MLVLLGAGYGIMRIYLNTKVGSDRFPTGYGGMADEQIIRKIWQRADFF